MSTIDIRDGCGNIDTIIFNDEEDVYGVPIASKILHEGVYIQIYDSTDEYVVLTTKVEVENLIKALNKAIQLGWVE